MERGSTIDPVLKAWVDRVLVPAMVREYLAIFRAAEENGGTTILAEDSDPSLQEKIQRGCVAPPMHATVAIARARRRFKTSCENVANMQNCRAGSS